MCALTGTCDALHGLHALGLCVSQKKALGSSVLETSNVSETNTTFDHALDSIVAPVEKNEAPAAVSKPAVSNEPLALDTGGLGSVEKLAVAGRRSTDLSGSAAGSLPSLNKDLPTSLKQGSLSSLGGLPSLGQGTNNGGLSSLSGLPSLGRSSVAPLNGDQKVPSGNDGAGGSSHSSIRAAAETPGSAASAQISDAVKASHEANIEATKRKYQQELETLETSLKAKNLKAKVDLESAAAKEQELLQTNLESAAAKEHESLASALQAKNEQAIEVAKKTFEDKAAVLNKSLAGKLEAVEAAHKTQVAEKEAALQSQLEADLELFNNEQERKHELNKTDISQRCEEKSAEYERSIMDNVKQDFEAEKLKLKDQHKAEFATLASDHESKVAEVKHKHATDLGDLDAQLSETKSNITHVAELQGSLKIAEDKNQDLHLQVKQLEVDIQSVQASSQQQVATITQLQGDLDGEAATVQQLKEALEDAKESQTKGNADQSLMNYQLLERDQEVAEMQEASAQKEQALTAKVSDMQLAIETDRAKFASVQADLDEANANVGDLQAQLQDAVASLGKLRTERSTANDSVGGEIELLRNKITDLEHEASTLQEDARSKDMQHAALQLARDNQLASATKAAELAEDELAASRRAQDSQDETANAYVPQCLFRRLRIAG